MKVTNTLAIMNFGCAKDLRKFRKNLKKELRETSEEIQKRIDHIEECLDMAESVSQIWKGKALLIVKGKTTYGISASISAPWTQRMARIYTNAQNRKYYGLTCQKGMKDIYNGYQGSGWPTYRKTLEAAKRWVAFGEEPDADNNWKPAQNLPRRKK